MQLDTTKATLYLPRSEKKILTLTIHKNAVSFVKGTVQFHKSLDFLLGLMVIF
jgi:hypothetical protein